MIQWNSVLANTAEDMGRVLGLVADATLRFSVWCETKADQLKWYARRLRVGDRGPSLMQWANRLIEFIDEDHIVLAFKRFEALVRVGVSPDHAFNLVVNHG